jgi:hypothetical protein
MNLDAFSKIASLVVAAAYVVLWMVLFGVRDQCLPRLLWFAFLCIIPNLALIWFPEAIADWYKIFLGASPRDALKRETPAWIIVFFGWFFLLGLPVFRIWWFYTRS